MGTDFLFAKPSCLRGISRILDIGATGNLYNESKTIEEADFKALKSDWQVVGNDMRYALDEYSK
jgi:hypothetical protein